MWHGWIIVNKSRGITSTQVVSRLKKHFGIKKMGHGGTLDPNATGLLPVAVGEATKTASYLLQSNKSYDFSIRWGIQTTTDDIDGNITQSSQVIPSAEQINQIIPHFTGMIEQVPPVYSALKVQGKRSYTLARQGQCPALSSRAIFIQSLEVISGAGEATTWFRVICSKGTYIRALARDMAISMGTVGCVDDLKRVKIGKIILDHAISLDYLEKLRHIPDQGHGFLQIHEALDDIPVIHVNLKMAKDLKKGRSIALADQINSDNKEKVCLCCFQNAALALGNAEGLRFIPKRVFNIIEV